MTLEELLPWLFSRTTGGIRWGLERTEEILAGAGDPHRRFRALHVGGTNGKGSVAALCAAALGQSGRAGRVGLYTSPHLVHFSERIRIDGEPVREDRLLAAAERLRPEIVRTGATFFEASTAIAFLCFAEAGIETAVVEVGLGGRLDATNVVDPLVTAVTNVALDHTEYLGETIEEIAREKAGIFKPGVPAITGARGEAVPILVAAAAAAGAPLHLLGERAEVGPVEHLPGGIRFPLRSRFWGERVLTSQLHGAHQAENAALAAEMLALLPAELRPDWESLAAGFAAVRWPGRLQRVRSAGTTWLFDVAHNPAGVEALASALDAMELPSPRVLVVSILADKAWREMLPPLLERSDAVVLTTPASAPDGRRWAAAEVADWIAARPGAPATRVIPDMAAALQRASTLAAHGSVLVTGSFYTVGDAMRILDIPSY